MYFINFCDVFYLFFFLHSVPGVVGHYLAYIY